MATTTPGYEPKDADPMTSEALRAVLLARFGQPTDPPTAAQVVDALVVFASVLDGSYADTVAGEAPRDETADSIDPATGTLTQEAVARRAELALELADDRTALEKAQARFDAASAAATADDAELAAAQADLDAAKAEDAKDEAELAALDKPAVDPSFETIEGPTDAAPVDPAEAI